MSTDTDVEPRWLKNLERWYEFAFKLSFILTGILSVYIILFFLVGGAFISDDNGPDSYSEWCEEYHPNLTYSECADVAGW